MLKVGQVAWKIVTEVAKAYVIKKSVDAVDKHAQGIVDSTKKHGFTGIAPSPAPFAPHFDPSGKAPFKKISMNTQQKVHPINLMQAAKQVSNQPVIRL